MSALNGVLSGPGVYKMPETYTAVEYGYGTGKPATIENQLGNALEQLESLVDRVQTTTRIGDNSAQAVTKILLGFPAKISGEIVFADADNLDTDNIYAGIFTYQDDMTTADMGKVCMENYDPEFRSITKPNDILVSGFNFGCGSSREQAATALLAREIRLVVAGCFSNIFVRNGVNNALPCLEVPRLVERLRTIFSENKVPTRRTGWTLTWDIARSIIEVQEGENGGTLGGERLESFSEKPAGDYIKGGVGRMDQA